MKTQREKRAIVERTVKSIYKKVLKEYSGPEYDGYTNFDTANAILYINNEQPLNSLIEKFRGKLTVQGLQKIFQRLRQLNPEGFAEIDQKNVNWQEIVDDENGRTN